MPLPTFVGAARTENLAGTVNATLPPGLQAGDLLLVFGTRSNQNALAAQGFTETQFTGYWGGVDATPPFKISNGAEVIPVELNWAYVLLAFRGVGSLNNIGQYGQEDSNTWDITSGTGLNVLEDNSVVVYFMLQNTIWPISDANVLGPHGTAPTVEIPFTTNSGTRTIAYEIFASSSPGIVRSGFTDPYSFDLATSLTFGPLPPPAEPAGGIDPTNRRRRRS